ncbi:type VI secretion system protein TssA [Paraburkholderia bonniea]|uniref:type VI secretion system protein TssA n=1 Tax=Paraburkholderia bonniea TaxID=2152891 RepID=UPI0012914D59|nr:type VI secretion system protein TssA [Paraburkholderia bonniea]
MQQQAGDEVQDMTWPQAAGGALLSAATIAAYSRDCEPFALAEAEIELLVAVSASRSTNWSQVASATTQVLTQHGKDLSAAVWLTVALLRTTGLTGLAEGVRGLRQMVSTYWEVMTPPVNRVRARDNQMQWLLDQLELCLAPGAQDSTWQPLDAVTYEALLADWDALDAFWSERHSDGPALFAARRMLAQLPVQDAAPVIDTASDSAVTPETQAAAAAPSSSPSAAAASSASGNASASTNTALPAAFSSATLLPAGGAAEATRSAEATREALEAALSGWSGFLLDCLSATPDAAFAYRLNRVSAWALIDTVPLATEAALTRVPAPPEAVRGVFDSVRAGGDASALVQFCESRLTQFPFWLDLCRYSYEALQRLGASQAAEAVAQDSRALAARLPGLLTLQFADGLPFADEATQRWLGTTRNAPRMAARPAALVPQTSNATSATNTSSANAGSSSQPDVLESTAEAAQAAAASGQLGAALSTLESYAQAQTTGRERFRARLAQCELLSQHDSSEALGRFVAPLVGQIEAHGLAHWEPELARRALVVAASAQLSSPLTEQDRWVAQLASVDLAGAWHLIFNADV